jgi:4,5-dihydroxyphthalate decarboxylase
MNGGEERMPNALTLACGDNEIVRPLITGKVNVDGVNLTILTDMDSATRH